VAWVVVLAAKSVAPALEALVSVMRVLAEPGSVVLASD